ncbi:hypothetical protein BC831DRAFT_274909 [Entophlyctis helioformis]|nr:hypothetical protein BC831DRAFT_274909 [Entophlyctis helioformis]
MPGDSLCPRSNSNAAEGMVLASLVALAALVLVYSATALAAAVVGLAKDSQQGFWSHRVNLGRQQPLQQPLQQPAGRLQNRQINRAIQACPALPPRPTKPTSVHDLRIDDFAVIASLGDSISAGFAAKGPDDSSTPIPMKNTLENRGVAFSMGGDDGAITLPNLMSKYRPGLVGASTGDHIAEICYLAICLPFQYWPAQDRFNAAQSGATVPTLFHEINYLVKQMETDPVIDFEHDFKLLTLFIGSNDVCLGCIRGGIDGMLSPEAFELHMRQVLDTLRSRVPRLVVNILMQFNVSQVWDATHKDTRCTLLRTSGLVFECICAFQPGPPGTIMRSLMDERVQQYKPG